VAQKIIEEKLKKFLAAENFQNLQFLWQLYQQRSFIIQNAKHYANFERQ
jgi:hypothetical protein